jgi:hypothetical protein
MLRVVIKTQQWSIPHEVIEPISLYQPLAEQGRLCVAIDQPKLQKKKKNSSF